MAKKKASIGNCPGCGYGLSQDDFECPQCGRVIFLDSSRDPDVEITRIKSQESVTNTRLNRAVDAAIEREREKTKRQNSKSSEWKWIIIVVLVLIALIVGTIIIGLSTAKNSEKETEQLVNDIQAAIDSCDFQKAEDLLIKLKTGGDSDYRKEMYKKLTERLENKKKDSSLVILFKPKYIFAV